MFVASPMGTEIKETKSRRNRRDIIKKRNISKDRNQKFKRRTRIQEEENPLLLFINITFFENKINMYKYPIYQRQVLKQL